MRAYLKPIGSVMIAYANVVQQTSQTSSNSLVDDGVAYAPGPCIPEPIVSLIDHNRAIRDESRLTVFCFLCQG